MLKIASFEEYHDDRPLLLKLITDDDGVDLDVVNEHGDHIPSGKLLAIRESGVYLYPGVSPEIGLPLDCEQKLKVFNPAAPAEVMELLKPLAEYVATALTPDYDDSEAWNLKDGKAITVGQFRAIAAYYKRHK